MKKRKQQFYKLYFLYDYPILTTTISVVVLLGGLLWLKAAQYSKQDFESKILARIGSITLTAQEVDRREKILKIFSPEYDGDSKKAAFDQMLLALTRAEIMARYDLPVTHEILETEAERIEKNSLMPPVLPKIQKLFGKNTSEDRTSYLKLYVLPVFTERVFYQHFFLSHPKIQTESYAKALRFFKFAQKHRDLSTAASQQRLKLIEFQVSQEEGVLWGHSNEPLSTELPLAIQEKMKQLNKAQNQNEGRYWIETLLLSRSPGELIPEVLDQQQHWLVARYLKPKPGDPSTFLMQGVRFPKADFNKWFEEEKKKILISYPSSE